MLSDRHAEWFGHIRENAERIETYLGTKSYDEFVSDELSHDAIERCLERICEASRRLGSVAEELIPDLNWQGIQGLGNVLQHDYDQLEQPEICRVVRDEVPLLRERTAALLERHVLRTEG